jgi:hypothetical protein
VCHGDEPDVRAVDGQTDVAGVFYFLFSFLGTNTTITKHKPFVNVMS